MLLRARPDSVRLGNLGADQKQNVSIQSEFFAVRKCASVSDRTEEKHFFEKKFSNDILYMTKIIVMKGGVKHEVNEPH